MLLNSLVYPSLIYETVLSLHYDFSSRGFAVLFFFNRF